MQPVALVASVVVAIVALGAAAWFGQAPDPAPHQLVPVARAEDSSIVVHVAGAVANPGLVSVPDGARVADAIAEAGGATGAARLVGLNLAALVSDGEQIVVPVEGDDSAVGVRDGKVAVNRASVEELQQLPGVGAVLAERIAQHREAFGSFATVEDLLDVTGIGEAKLEGMRDAILLP